MFERDYLMRMLLSFYEAVAKSILKEKEERDPERAADMLDDAIGQACDLDADALLSLAPESIAGVLQVSGVDAHAVEYVAQSMLLASRYRLAAGDPVTADLRAAQAQALADAYGFDLPDDPEDFSRLEQETEG